MARAGARAKLEVMKPELGAKPRVYYRNLWRYSKCFIGGSVAEEKDGVVECVEGASVQLVKDGASLAVTTTDNFGDFKFDKLDENSGSYTVQIFCRRPLEERRGQRSAPASISARSDSSEPAVKTFFATLTFLACFGGASLAQMPAYPDHPITIVITSVPGGVTDVVGRALGQELTKAWGQQVVIENKGGAAHIIGAEAVAKAAPDGYTLLVGESGTFTVNPTIYPKEKLPFDTEKDFIPITGLVRIYQALLADKALPVGNAAELIALAKQNPGQLTYGTAGIGSALHMNMELFDSMAGVKLVPVHYRGATPALNDLIGGSINTMTVSVASALPPYKAGQIKMLGIGSPKRLPPVADIPTVSESGLPGYEATAWFGLFGPAGMPRDIVMKLDREVAQIFSDPAFRARFLDPQMFESMAASPEEFADYIKAERAKWSKVIREADIKLE